MGSFLSQPRAAVVAICDVDANNLAEAAKRAPGARTYGDWREMFEREGDRIDSVNVTVPDHMHAAISMAALAKRKHGRQLGQIVEDMHEAGETHRLYEPLVPPSIESKPVARVEDSSESGAQPRSPVRER